MSRVLLPDALGISKRSLKSIHAAAVCLAITPARFSAYICLQGRASNGRRRSTITQKRTITQQPAITKTPASEEILSLLRSDYSRDAKSNSDESHLKQIKKHFNKEQFISSQDFTRVIRMLWDAKDRKSASQWYIRAFGTDQSTSIDLPSDLPHHALTLHWLSKFDATMAQDKANSLIRCLPSQRDSFQAALVDRIRHEFDNVTILKNGQQSARLQELAEIVFNIRTELRKGPRSFQSYVKFGSRAIQHDLMGFSMPEIWLQYKKALKHKLPIMTNTYLDLMHIAAFNSKEGILLTQSRVYAIAGQMKKNHLPASDMAYKYILKTMVDKVSPTPSEIKTLKDYMKKVEDCMRKNEISCSPSTLVILLRAASHVRSPAALTRYWEEYTPTVRHPDSALYSTFFNACARLQSTPSMEERICRYAVTNVQDQMDRQRLPLTPSVAIGLMRCYMKLENGIRNIEQILIKVDDCVFEPNMRQKWINTALQSLLNKLPQRDYRYDQFAVRWVFSMTEADRRLISPRIWPRLMTRASDSVVDSARMFKYHHGSNARSDSTLSPSRLSVLDKMMLSRLVEALNKAPDVLARQKANLPFFASNRDTKALATMPTEHFLELVDSIIKSKAS